MSRPLRFLHFATFYPPYNFGGDGLYVYRLCHALGDAGHEVDVVHCVDSFQLFRSKPAIAFAEHPRVTRHALRSKAGPLSPLLTHQTGRPLLKRSAIRKVLDSKRYDVIHYHNMSLLGADVLRMDSVHGPAVKVYMAHEHWLVCPMHVLWKYNQRPCEKPDCFSCVVRGKRPPQLWRQWGLLDDASRHVDLFLSPSRFTADMHATRGFNHPFRVLPYFVPREIGPGDPVQRPHERPYFLFVGRLEYIKGLQTLIDLWRDISEFDLLVAGGGQYDGELKRQAAGNPRILFLGPQPQDRLAGLYGHALACIVPSVTYETFGIVCIEAFLQETPVIARDLGGLSEVVKESGGGLLYRTQEELREAIHKIGGSPKVRADLGRRGRQAYERQWTPEAHLERYFDLLRGAATGKFAAVPWEEQADTDRHPARIS